MKHFFIILLTLPFACSHADEQDIKKYKQQALNVTIIRDNYGVAHVYGKTDADAVFGLMYAQCEESFERVERNYIERLGRLSEIEGETYKYADLQMRLLYDTAAAIRDFQNSPSWLKKLLYAFADGINFYIHNNPRKPLMLSRFEPWFPLMFTDGGYTGTQTGGLGYDDLAGFYEHSTGVNNPLKSKAVPTGSTGSNGFAIGPSKSASNNAMLYINPHVSFYFRSEMHMVSEEGLNVYGAVTWGQFFVFQGFNDNLGWMHTSSLADAADVYEEKVIKQGSDLVYEYNGQFRKVTSKPVTIHYKKDKKLLPFKLTAYYTHHGPVMGRQNEAWLTLKERNRSMDGLIQSWQRTKAKNFAEFSAVLSLRSNNSTNTLYADNKGNIAYWHGNFIPLRDAGFNWSSPVDGSTSATEWKGLHDVNEIVQLHNPKQGWLQNCNSSPFSAAGFNSLSKQNYPKYMAPDDDNFRSMLAIRELEKESKYTAEKLISLGYNNYLAAFDSLLPPLIKAYDALPVDDTLRQILNEPIVLLKAWDKRSTINSIATTLAVEWGLTLLQHSYQNSKVNEDLDQPTLFAFFARNAYPGMLLAMLKNVTDGLVNYYGKWQISWGDINRYQRNTGSIQPKFNDEAASYPVGMASALFGSLPSFETAWPGTKKGYGVAGNSFVAIVEFGSIIKAKSIITGGQSFQPGSNHFNDQAEMYINGKFKDVYFYKKDVVRHAERTYHPGAR